MSEGLIYEPRSLWSIARVASTALDQQFRLDKRHFFNGTRWPIQIRRVALMAVNYVIADAPAGLGGQPPEETQQILQKCRVGVSVPQRYHLSSKRMVLTGAVAPEPSGQPPVEQVDIGSSNFFTPSSQYGVSMLKFDKPLILPRTGTIEWGLSAHTAYNGVGKGGDEDRLTQAWMLYQEEGGLFAGSARARRVDLAAFTGNTTQSIESWPYPPDGFGAGVPVGTAVASNNWWPPQSRFPAAGNVPDAAGQRNTTFAAQESTRAGSTRLTDMRIYVDQLEYDSRMDNAGGYGGHQPSMLATRMGCSVKTVNSGSKTNWWRPGAPVGLVFDYLSPANVYDLPEEITLGPGEQLDVEMTFPAEITSTTNFQIGIAFNGYAAIEG